MCGRCDIRSAAAGGADVGLDQVSAGTDEPVTTSVNGTPAGLN